MQHHGVSSLDVEPTPRSTADGSGTGTRADRIVLALAIATAISTFALVVLGSTVRVTNSGMGCPSWPLCFGQVGPIDQYHALLEQSHRYLAGLVSVAAFSTALAAWRAHARKMAFGPAAAAALLVVVQAALGALTVLAKNAPWTVAVHLVVGLTFLGVTVVTSVTAVLAPRGSWRPGAVGRWGWALLVSMLATIVGGSLVVANGAGGACPAWPLCPSSAPDLANWQLLHRSLAGVAGVSLVGFVASRWRTTAGWRAWRTGALASIGLYVVVAAFGAASALTKAKASWQDIHLTVVALLWALVVATVSALAIGHQRVGASEPTEPSAVRAEPTGPSAVRAEPTGPSAVRAEPTEPFTAGWSTTSATPTREPGAGAQPPIADPRWAGSGASPRYPPAPTGAAGATPL